MYSRHGQFSNIFCFYLFFATRGEKATSNQRVEPTPQSWENTSLTTRLQGHIKTLAAVCTTDSHPMPTRLPSAALHKSADESGVCCFPDQQTRCASRKPSIVKIRLSPSQFAFTFSLYIVCRLSCPWWGQHTGVFSICIAGMGNFPT